MFTFTRNNIVGIEKLTIFIFRFWACHTKFIFQSVNNYAKLHWKFPILTRNYAKHTLCSVNTRRWMSVTLSLSPNLVTQSVIRCQLLYTDTVSSIKRYITHPSLLLLGGGWDITLVSSHYTLFLLKVFTEYCSICKLSHWKHNSYTNDNKIISCIEKFATVNVC